MRFSSSLRRGILAGMLQVVALAGCSRHRAAPFKGVTFDPPEPVPPVVLTRADGAPFALRDQRGAAVLLFFGYTHCPDLCPTTLGDWIKVKRALGADAARVRFVFVSVDPSRDTPALTQHYVSTFDPQFIGLSGDSAQVARAESLFHVTSSRESTGSANGYAVAHSAQAFLIDPQGRVRLLYPPGIPPADVASDIEQLLHNA